MKKIFYTASHIFISSFIMIGIVLQLTNPVLARTEQDTKSVANQTVFYDPTEPCNATNRATSNTSAAAGGVFVLGDSLGVGLTDPSSQPLLKALTASDGWSVSGDTKVGRTLAEGIQIANNPPEQLKSATTILVVLGTNNVNNSSANKNDIAALVNSLKTANNNAPIYWLKVNVTRSDLTEGAAAYNKLLDGASSIKTITNSAELSSDKVHPKEYGKLASDIALSFKGVAQSSTVSIGGCSCSSVSVALTGSDNAEKVFRYFIGKGLSAVQAAGIMGNISQESGFDPEIKQGGGRTRDPSVFGTGVGVGKAWGLIQWDAGGRAVEYAKKAGITSPIYELATQLELVWWHMNNESPTAARNMYAEYSKITDVEEATKVYEKKMEGAGTPRMERRIAAAKDYLTLYGGASNPGSSSDISVSSGSCSDIVGSGEDTKFIDGFTVYSQNDPAWKDKAYSSSTIGASGCGPAAMAMIITNLTGSKVTPYDVATYAASKGMYVPGEGSSWQISPVVADNWGLKAKNIGVNLEAISATLQAGGLVITAGKGAKPFTSGGHFIVIRGITADGKLKVGDSGHSDTSDKEWDAAQLLASMEGRDGSVYAITR